MTTPVNTIHPEGGRFSIGRLHLLSILASVVLTGCAAPPGSVLSTRVDETAATEADAGDSRETEWSVDGEPQADDEIEAGFAGVVGRVVSNTGEYLSDAVVRVSFGAGLIAPEDRDFFETKTDAGGRYRIKIPTRDESDFAQVEFLKDGYRGVPTRCVNCPAIANVALKPRHTSYASYVLDDWSEWISDIPIHSEYHASPRPGKTQPAKVAGRIIDTHGQPLKGALVRVAVPATDMRNVYPGSGDTLFEGQTGKDGRYEIQVLLNGYTSVSVDAMTPGFHSGYGKGNFREAKASAGKTAHASFVLERALYVTGATIDEKGVPVPQVKVTAISRQRNSYGYISVTSSLSDGSFELFDYPLQPWGPPDDVVKGEIEFEHPDYGCRIIKDVYALSQEERESLQIVLLTRSPDSAPAN